jgi:hypothetical protein
MSATPVRLIRGHALRTAESRNVLARERDAAIRGSEPSASIARL